VLSWINVVSVLVAHKQLLKTLKFLKVDDGDFVKRYSTCDLNSNGILDGVWRWMTGLHAASSMEATNFFFQIRKSRGETHFLCKRHSTL